MQNTPKVDGRPHDLRSEKIAKPGRIVFEGNIGREDHVGAMAMVQEGLSLLSLGYRKVSLVRSEGTDSVQMIVDQARNPLEEIVNYGRDFLDIEPMKKFSQSVNEATRLLDDAARSSFNTRRRGWR